MANIDKQKLLNAISASYGGRINEKKFGTAAQSGDVSALLGSLPEEDRKKLLNALSDKKSLSALLSNEKTKSIIDSFSEKSKQQKK